ncbi:HPr family phosphocarrier protein [Ruminococcaceae bacterium OttesenSCG-928-A16]|nr:HPr family phosphocarrier protein [Ruminococcaceae bacterium OttesenSCG-928-A16]
MKTITYTITDELGIHARPAGQLVKNASAFASNIQVGTPAKMVDAKRIMGVMGLAVKHGQQITLTFEGPDEEAAAAALQEFLQTNL